VAGDDGVGRRAVDWAGEGAPSERRLPSGGPIRLRWAADPIFQTATPRPPLALA